MTVVAVIGLGYVGLPLVVEFGKRGRTIGFDISVPKVESCQRGVTPSRELPDVEMAAVYHKELVALSADDMQKKLIKGGCFIDVKAGFDQAALEGAGFRVWRL